MSPSALISIWHAKLEEPADVPHGSASAARLPEVPRATSLADGVRNRLRLPTLRSAKASLSGASSTASTPSCLSPRSEAGADPEAASRRRGRAATLGPLSSLSNRHGSGAATPQAATVSRSDLFYGSATNCRVRTEVTFGQGALSTLVLLPSRTSFKEVLQGFQAPQGAPKGEKTKGTL